MARGVNESRTSCECAKESERERGKMFECLRISGLIQSEKNHLQLGLAQFLVAVDVAAVQQRAFELLQIVLVVILQQERALMPSPRTNRTTYLAHQIHQILDETVEFFLFDNVIAILARQNEVE